MMNEEDGYVHNGGSMTDKRDDALKLALKDLERSESAMHKARAIIREALDEPQEKYVYGTPLLDAMTGKANEALDKMAENARELGLDYEPAQLCKYPYCGCNSKAWCKVERMAENARELGLGYEPAQQQTFKQRLAEVEKDLQTLKQSAREMLAELETYHDQYPGMAKGYVLDAMEQLKRAVGVTL